MQILNHLHETRNQSNFHKTSYFAILATHLIFFVLLLTEHHKKGENSIFLIILLSSILKIGFKVKK